MLDINFIRKNPGVVKKAAVDKLMNVDIDRLLELDAQIRELILLIDKLREERNGSSKQILQFSDDNKKSISENVKIIKIKISELETKLGILKKEFNDIMLTVPSVPSPEIPIGRDEKDNVEIKRWGHIPEFNFTPKDHLELLEKHNLVDISRATKFAGSRSYFLKNEGLLLEMAICRFVIDNLVSKGFMPMSVPLIVKDIAMIGTGYFPFGYDQAYKLPEGIN